MRNGLLDIMPAELIRKLKAADLVRTKRHFQNIVYSLNTTVIAFPFSPGDTVQVIYSLEENFYNGRQLLQLMVKEMRPAA